MQRLSPAGVMVLVLVAATAFVGARWQVAAHRDISRFVVAGADYTSPAAGVHVQPGPGYDGQFSYRLAVDPTDLDRRAHGVAIDAPLRLQRISYPALAHLVALGQRSWVPWALVVVNVLALALLALLAAEFARDHGRAPLAGLLVAGFFGFATTLGRDLTELVTATLLVAGVLAWERRHPVLAVLAFSGAVLSRESGLLLYAVFIAVELSRRRDRRLVVLGAVPLLAFAAWQVVCAATVGRVPLLTSSGKNLVPPFVDLVPAAGGWVRDAAALDRAGLITLGQAVTLLVVLVLTAVAVRRSTVAAGVKAAWCVAALLAASLSANVWKGPADFRTAAELYVLSALVLLASQLPLRLPAALLGVTALMTALFRITSI